jgi:2'-5' RNA ligase
MTQTPEWATHHAEQMRDHWWWRPGWDVGKRFYTWHLTFENQPDLHHLVATYQQRLAHFPHLDFVPQQWLHLTMQGVGFTHDLDKADLDRVITTVEEHLGQQAPFEVTFDRLLVRPEAITLVPTPVEPVIAVRAAIRAAMSEALAVAPVPEADTFQPHVSLAYSNNEHATADLIRDLDKVEPSPVKATISQAALIELHRDNRMYEWRTITVAELGAGDR